MTRHALFLGIALALGGTTGAHPLASAQEPEVAAAAAAARARRNDPEALARHARVLLRAGRFDEASRVFHRVSQLRRNDPAALYEEASVGFAKNDFRAARNACRALEGRHRDSVYLHVCLARSFLTLNRSARAFESLAAAEAIDPNAFELQLAIGEANRLRMNFDTAEAAYRRAIELAPTAASARLGLGRLYRAANRHDDALRELEQALALDPAWPEVQYELGEVVGGTRGLELLRLAARGCPNVPQGQTALGDLELAFGEPEAARAAYAKAIELDDLIAPAHVGLGRALARLGRDVEAELALRHALTMVPNSTTALIALAEIHARADRLEEAFEDYRRAADGSPGNPTPLLAGAQLAVAHGRDTLAQAFLDRLLAMNDGHAVAHALYGDVLTTRRDFAGAVAAYDRALALPDLPERARVEAARAAAQQRSAARR